MKSLNFVLMLAAMVAFGSAAEAVECHSLLSNYNTDNAHFITGQQQPCPTPPASKVFPEGEVYVLPAPVATATGTAEQTLGTYSLPASAFDNVGRHIRARINWSAAANGNNKTVKLYFGSELISTGVLTSNAKNGYLEIDAYKTGSNTQQVWGIGYVDTTNITPYAATGAETDTGAIVIKATGTDGTSSASDITLNDLVVEYLN